MIRVFNELTDFCFKHVDTKYIFVIAYGVIWTKYNTDNSATLTKVGLKSVRGLTSVFRFIDDPTAINDCGKCERSSKEMYPSVLELKEEDWGNIEGSILDLFKQGNKSFMTLCDKSDVFPFSIVRMSHLTSNIPSKMFYGSNGKKILRFARVTNIKTNFINHSSNDPPKRKC